MAKRILVLDDDEIRHEAFSTALYGNIVTHVWTVFEACEALAENDKFDLVYLDHDLNDHEVSSTMESSYGQVELTGYDVARFIATKLKTSKRPDKVIVHSWNPPGARLMVACLRESGIIATYEPFRGEENKLTEQESSDEICEQCETTNEEAEEALREAVKGVKQDE